MRRQVSDRTGADRLRGLVGRGEADAIVLARALKADFLVLDDVAARRVAEAEGQNVTGVLGLLVHSQEHGIIRSVRPILDRLVAAGFYIDDPLYRLVLEQAREESSS